MGDENPIHTLGDYSKPSHEVYRNTIELPAGNNVVPLRSYTIRLVQNGCSFHGLRSEDPNQHLKDFLKLVDSLDLDSENRERTRMHLFQFSLRDQDSNWLERLPAGSISTCCKIRDLNAEESWALLEDLALYDNESWNDPRDFAKPVKAIALPKDVPSTSDCRLIKLENQVQRLMEAYLSLTQPTQVTKITTSCEICSGPHDTQYCMENPEQAFVEYASSRTDEAGEGLVSEFMASQDARLSKFEADFKQHQSEMTTKIDTVLKANTDRIAGTLPSDTVKNPKLGTHPVSSAHLEKEHTKSVYLRNEEDKRREVEYVMSKILRIYKECLELGPEYVRGMDDEGEVTLYLMRRSMEILRKFYWMILGGRFNQLSHVSSPLLSKPGEY
ncbi:hypothetical protein Tco_0955993 [Tanacetum coccineum]|uniref:MAK10-like protein n=1 Tax=Tanacetum coccineum TaxID=301880 RepID=A0ABQ5E8S2_9ASTR